MNAKAKTLPVGIVGAGLCGLTLARQLREAGVPAVLFEKSRGLGGRFATRRTEGGPVDHGISWIDSRSANEVPEVGEWLRSGWLVPSVTDSKKLICPMGMTEIAKRLASGFDVEKEGRVTKVSIAPGASSWLVAREGRNNNREVSTLILTQPVPQALELWQASFPGQIPRVTEDLAKVTYRPTIVLLGSLAEKDRAKKFVAKAPFELVVGSHAKGIENATNAAAAYFGETFSRKHFEEAETDLLARAVEAFRQTYKVALESAQVKKWRYSRAVDAFTTPFYRAPVRPALYFAGDGFAGGEIEGALRSARELAREFLKK